MNLNRINWNTPATQGGPGAAGSDTYYAWSPVPGLGFLFIDPTSSDGHVLDKFSSSTAVEIHGPGASPVQTSCSVEWVIQGDLSRPGID
jgi:hypothetical protein